MKARIKRKKRSKSRRRRNDGGRIYETPEAAEYTNIPAPSLRRLVHQGKLEALAERGRRNRLRFREGDLDALLAQRGETSSAGQSRRKRSYQSSKALDVPTVGIVNVPTGTDCSNEPANEMINQLNQFISKLLADYNISTEQMERDHAIWTTSWRGGDLLFWLWFGLHVNDHHENGLDEETGQSSGTKTVAFFYPRLLCVVLDGPDGVRAVSALDQFDFELDVFDSTLDDPNDLEMWACGFLSRVFRYSDLYAEDVFSDINTQATGRQPTA